MSKIRVAVCGYGVIGRRVVDAVALQRASDGIAAINSTAELMKEIGRPRGRLAPPNLSASSLP